MVLLLDHRGEPLVLQMKEARGSVLAPFVEKAGFPVPSVAHEGRRVVLGQRRMQVVSDILLGWTTVQGLASSGGGAAGADGAGADHGSQDGLPFQVRQFRNRKGSVDPTQLSGDQMDDYARMTGALLARAHSHSADPRLLAGYCGKNEELDEAIASFAVSYADRTEADHAALIAAVKSGRIEAEMGV